MKKNIITISREFGSGGRTIGKTVAERLGVPCYDKELVKQVALESGFDPKFIEERGESAPGKNRFAYAFLGRGTPGVMGGMSASDFLWTIQYRVIQDLAEKGPCVIVGRCSDYVLGERSNCLKVFIYADLADRVTRCAEEYHIETANMTERVKEIDRGRANYYNYYTGHNWGEMRQYDLTLNSSVTGVDGAVELIATLVRLWEKRDQENR